MSLEAKAILKKLVRALGGKKGSSSFSACLQETLGSLAKEQARALLEMPIDSTQCTLLHRAAERGNVEAITCLVRDYGVDPDPRMQDGKTPLGGACNHGHEEAAKLLISFGANVNAHKTNGWTPLMYATSSCSLPIVKALLSAQPPAMVNELNREGASACYLACREGFQEIAETLIDAGANIHQKTLSGRSMLHGAISGGNSGLVAQLLKISQGGGDLIEVDNLGQSLWHEAAAKGNVEMIDVLLENGVPITTAAEKARGQHFLHYAAIGGHADFMTAILDRKLAEPDVEDGDGASPLYYGASNGKDEVVSVLLRNGADANFRHKNLPRTPLHAAVGWKHYGCVERLLEAGCDPNSLDAHGDTPLIYACRIGDPKFVSLLLKHGAKAVGKRNEGGETHKPNQSLIDIAKSHGHAEIVDLLEKCNI